MDYIVSSAPMYAALYRKRRYHNSAFIYVLFYYCLNVDIAEYQNLHKATCKNNTGKKWSNVKCKRKINAKDIFLSRKRNLHMQSRYYFILPLTHPGWWSCTHSWCCHRSRRPWLHACWWASSSSWYWGRSGRHVPVCCRWAAPWRGQRRNDEPLCAATPLSDQSHWVSLHDPGVGGPSLWPPSCFQQEPDKLRWSHPPS